MDLEEAWNSGLWDRFRCTPPDQDGRRMVYGISVSKGGQRYQAILDEGPDWHQHHAPNDPPGESGIFLVVRIDKDGSTDPVSKLPFDIGWS